MKVICKFNNPDKVPYGVSSNFDYGLEAGKSYLVMGIMVNGGQFSYFIDVNGKPGFFPIELFEINDGKLSPEWYFKPYSRNDRMYPYVQAVWGYYELCFDENHYKQLIERDKDAMHLYFKRKMEAEEEFREREVVNRG